MPKTVCLDFDGVLAQYDGWKGEAVLGDPLPGMSHVVELLRDHGFDVVVHTTRKPEYVELWLAAHGFPPLLVAATKPPAICYVDDRGLRFEGPPFDPRRLVETIESYRTYWER